MEEVKLSIDADSRMIKSLAKELLKWPNERYELFPVITQLACKLHCKCSPLYGKKEITRTLAEKRLQVPSSCRVASYKVVRLHNCRLLRDRVQITCN